MKLDALQTPWLNNYPQGVEHEINPDHYGSLIELFEESFGKFQNKEAFECMGGVMTFNEIDLASQRFAAYLQNHTNLKAGDRIAIQMPNVLQYPIVMFGALRAGLIVVNTNPLYTEREMEHQFNDSGAKAIIILANFADKLEKILPKTDLEHVIITEIGDLLPFPKNLIVNTVVKYVKKMVPSFNLPNAVKLKDTLRKGEQSTFTKPVIKSDDIAFLQYTGGTTGVSKGAMLTHRNVIANLEQNATWMAPSLKEGEEVIITPLPLYHIFSLTVNCLTMMKYGVKNVLITNPRDIKGFIKELKKHKFSIMTGVNTLFNGLLNHPDFKTINFDALKVCVGGGMAVQKAVALRWQEVTNCPLTEGYGLTETAPVLCCNPIDGSGKIGHIGLPFPSTQVVIMNDEGDILNQGEVGEICAKGPQVMKGYWQRPEETQKTFTEDGWLRTGDIGLMDKDGYFKIVDRKKDMICVSGFNVYPNEVEDVVAMHPGVTEVAVIGVPDERSTEAVKVFVVKKDEALSVEELKKFCKENLTGYKVPKHYEFRDELPKTNVGKILRRSLKEEEMKKMGAE
ncbi:AMP-binding protein [Algivirga pacifica]|uniref:Long-chain-fatty-acid--CoA ligase n=1 Tax=Algivirga pacifica TaxID=1162670 RepID=A0ABP9DDG4_9BACT